jgi:hypothetical protein
VRCIHQDDARFWKSSLAYFFKVHAIDDAEQAEIIRQLVSTKRYKSKDGLWRLTVVKHDSPTPPCRGNGAGPQRCFSSPGSGAYVSGAADAKVVGCQCQEEAAMIRIAITQAAYDAISATVPLGTVAVEPEASERGERLIWLEAAMVDRLGAMRGPSESYSDVIPRIAGRKGRFEG